MGRHEERVEESKKLYPQLNSFILQLAALSDRTIGFGHLLNHENEGVLKSLNIDTGNVNALAAALKTLPVLTRIMKADEIIEKFMAKTPKAFGAWGKLSISQLHEIDTRLTVLKTRLSLIVVNAMLSYM